MSSAGLSTEGAEPVAGRPRMAPGYGIVTGPEGLLTWEEAARRLERSRNYWVSTTRPDGRPHAAPLWGVWLDNAFYFGTERDSRKGRNLAANPEIVAHLESGDEVVILEGTAEEVTDWSNLARFADAYEVKYGFRPDVNGGGPIYRVRPRAAYGWMEKDYPKTATRWVFGQR